MKKTVLTTLIALTSLTFAGLSSAEEAAAPAKYQSACFACHGTGAAGAPKTGDKEAWAPKVELGLETLIASVRKGKGAMPPGGLCADCSDDELKELIEYMADHTFE